MESPVTGKDPFESGEQLPVAKVSITKNGLNYEENIPDECKAFAQPVIVTASAKDVEKSIKDIAGKIIDEYDFSLAEKVQAFAKTADIIKEYKLQDKQARTQRSFEPER